MTHNQSITHQPTNVNTIVHDLAFYVNICEEQSAVFRQHVEEFTNEYALYSQSADVVKPGQNWEPAAGDQDAYIAEMKRRCQEVPKSIAEWTPSFFYIFWIAYRWYCLLVV